MKRQRDIDTETEEIAAIERELRPGRTKRARTQRNATSELYEAARAVLANWAMEGGNDLAAAVRRLGAAADEYERATT